MFQTLIENRAQTFTKKGLTPFTPGPGSARNSEVGGHSRCREREIEGETGLLRVLGGLKQEDKNVGKGVPQTEEQCLVQVERWRIES